MIDKTQIRSFGRIRGRNLKDSKINKLDNILPKYLIKIEEDKITNLPTNNKLLFEIGFGYGEHTLHQAKLHPDYNIIACETYINGVLSLLDKIEENKINNINIYNLDARYLLEKMPDNSIDIIYILFPDPWPKKKQNKRRIINAEFIDLVKSKLKKGGILFFASDILNYVEWTMEFVFGKLKPTFNNIEECKKEPQWWIRTRYQEKAIRENRESYFLEFRK